MCTMQISEEEGRLKKDEEETKEMWKRKREHEEKWEETRDQRVSLQFICRKLKCFILIGHYACGYLNTSYLQVLPYWKMKGFVELLPRALPDTMCLWFAGL